MVHVGGHADSLPELIQSVLSTHPSLRSQKAQGESAAQALESARWQFYPTPSIGLEQVDTSTQDPNYPSYGDKNVTTVRLQQPLWTAGRLTAGLDKAQAGVLASQATLENIRQDLALRVVQVVSDWYGGWLKGQALDKSLQYHQTLREQILRRIANGVSPQSDLTLLLGRQQQTEADLSAALAQEQGALARLIQMLGHALPPHALVHSLGAAPTLDTNARDLMEHAQAQHPSVIKLQAQARMAEAEIIELRASLSPELYLRAERQYGNYTVANSAPVNRYFLGFSSNFGAGLSSLSQVGGAQARYAAALADIDSTRVSLGEEIQADYAQAEAGLVRLDALRASLSSSDNLAKAWSRQFIAGRKTWLDVMNAVREEAQLETQIADAKASQLLLSWRLAIVGRGLDRALDQASAALSKAPVTQTTPATPAHSTADAFSDLNWETSGQLPLYAQDGAEAIALRQDAHIDPLHLGLHLGLGTSVDPAAAPYAGHTRKEDAW